MELSSLVVQLVKNPPCNVGDLGSIPGFERSSEEGKGYLLQYSGLKNSMDCIVHGVTKSRTQLSGFYFLSEVRHEVGRVSKPWNHFQKLFGRIY